jgi:glycosyltransferase involved in cell wall biosynthesis
MTNISKVNKKIFLLNAYSNYDPKVYFISGSDKVALELAKIDIGNSVILGPSSIVSILPKNLKFYTTQSKYTGVLIIDYLIRTINSIKIITSLDSRNILISTTDFFCDVLPAFINRHGNIWYTFTYHLYPSFLVNFKFRDLFGKLLQDFSYLLSKSASKNFTSNFECVTYLKEKFKYNQVLKIPLGVNLVDYYSKDIKDIDILFLGRIKESKGIFDLPEIVSLIKSKIPNLKVVVIGNGPESEKIRLRELDSRFNSSLIMLGSVSDPEVRDNLSRTKLLIQLDSENGFGLSIVEALASRCIVTGFDLPSYRDNFPDLGLNMCPQGQKEVLAKKIIEILINYSQPAHLGSKLDRFDWNSIYKTIFNS